MKKENWALGLSIVSIVVSIIAILISMFRCEPFNYDTISLLIGVSSAAVTIYIGVQIVQALTIKSEIKETIEKNKNDIKKECEDMFKEKIDDYNFGIAGNLLQILGIERYNRSHYERAFDYFIDATEQAKQCSEKDVLDGILNYLMLFVNKNECLSIEARERDRYIKVISDIKDDRVIKIIKYLSFLKCNNQEDFPPEKSQNIGSSE